MNFSITFHIDFGRVCDRLLSRNCILFRRAVMPKVTYVLRERRVERHRKYRMKMQKSMLCMDHLASISLVTNHRIWVWKRASLGRRISNSFGGKIYSKNWYNIDPKLPQNGIENKVGFRISFWFDFGSLLEGLQGQSRPKYLIDFELIFDRVSGWGCAKGSDGTPPLLGYFLVSEPL